MIPFPRSIVSVAAQAIAFLGPRPIPSLCTLGPYMPPIKLHPVALHYGMYE